MTSPPLYMYMTSPPLYMSLTNPPLYISLTNPPLYISLTNPPLYMYMTSPPLYMYMTSPSLYMYMSLFSAIQWFVICYTVSFQIAYAEYILMEPSEEYQHIMSSVHEKIYLSKVRDYPQYVTVTMATASYVTTATEA